MEDRINQRVTWRMGLIVMLLLSLGFWWVVSALVSL
jgi:hypothetical protein